MVVFSISCIVSSLLLLAYGRLLLRYRKSWFKLPVYTAPDIQTTPVPVTVIIPARNEESNIEKCITAILAQDYPAALIQIIVVNDHSTDRTAELVKKCAGKNVELINLSDYEPPAHGAYKKMAIDMAIRKATGELIITTDADCICLPQWISFLVSFYLQHKSVAIVMPVQFSPVNGPLGVFQSLDFMTLQGITASTLAMGKAMMCNGANFAYTKTAFHAVNGFTDINDVASGDDMLLLHKLSEKFPGQIHYLKAKEVIVKTLPMQNLSGFLQQRIRWASKTGKYKDAQLMQVLYLVYGINFLSLLIVILLIVFQTKYWLLLFLVFIIIKVMLEMLYLHPVAKFFSREQDLKWFPIAKPFHVLYTILAGFFGRFGKYEWKGRQLR